MLETQRNRLILRLLVLLLRNGPGPFHFWKASRLQVIAQCVRSERSQTVGRIELRDVLVGRVGWVGDHFLDDGDGGDGRWTMGIRIWIMEYGWTGPGRTSHNRGFPVLVLWRRSKTLARTASKQAVGLATAGVMSVVWGRHWGPGERGKRPRPVVGCQNIRGLGSMIASICIGGRGQSVLDL